MSELTKAEVKMAHADLIYLKAEARAEEYIASRPGLALAFGTEGADACKNCVIIGYLMASNDFQITD